MGWIGLGNNPLLYPWFGSFQNPDEDMASAGATRPHWTTSAAPCRDGLHVPSRVAMMFYLREVLHDHGGQRRDARHHWPLATQDNMKQLLFLSPTRWRWGPGLCHNHLWPPSGPAVAACQWAARHLPRAQDQVTMEYLNIKKTTGHSRTDQCFIQLQNHLNDQSLKDQ